MTVGGPANQSLRFAHFEKPKLEKVLSPSQKNTRFLTKFPEIQIRQTRLMNPPQHNFEKNLLHCKWSPDGAMVAAGSADRFVYVWDAATRRILYKLPGHLGSVNDVDFHLIEPIGKKVICVVTTRVYISTFLSVLSASSDKSIYLGEFEP